MKTDRFTFLCACTLCVVIVVLSFVMGFMAYDLWLSGLTMLAVIPVALAVVCILLLVALGRDLFRVEIEDKP